MKSHEPDQYLEDILEAITRIERYVASKTLRDFEDDDLLFDAVMMRLQIIGESVAKLPSQIRQKEIKIPWQQIIGLRNYISYAYAFLDAERVWLVIENDLPKLKQVVAEWLDIE